MSFTEKTKTEVRRKSHFSCCLCKSVGVEVHHIIPEEENGKDTMDNAAPLCPSCHELYGGNPTKRKVIKEARDLWYEICEKRYASDYDRLKELAFSIDNLKETVDIKFIKEEISNELINKLQQLGIIKTDNKAKGLPLSKVIERILNFEKEIKIPNEESLRITYRFLFETVGDPENSIDDKEYNDLRCKFLSRFGTLVAQNICRKIINEDNVDFKKGVMDSTMSGMVTSNLAIMMALLDHEDISTGNDKFGIDFTENGEMLIMYKKA